MIQIVNRKWKLAYLTTHQKGLCGCGCGIPLDNTDQIDLHHLVSDSRVNRKTFPRALQSTFVLRAIRHGHHIGFTEGKLPHKTFKYLMRLEIRLIQDNPITRRVAYGN